MRRHYVTYCSKQETKCKHWFTPRVCKNDVQCCSKQGDAKWKHWFSSKVSRKYVKWCSKQGRHILMSCPHVCYTWHHSTLLHCKPHITDIRYTPQTNKTCVLIWIKIFSWLALMRLQLRWMISVDDGSALCSGSWPHDTRADPIATMTQFVSG